MAPVGDHRVAASSCSIVETAIGNPVSKKVQNILLEQNLIPLSNITTTKFDIVKKMNSTYIPENKTTINIFDGFVVTNKIDLKIKNGSEFT